MINTRFWSDGFVVNLNPLDRYLFLYFLTNEHTNISGIYELPLRVIAFETGIEKDMIEKMLLRLEDKIKYFDGWIYIKNFSKHQSDNASVKKGIEKALEQIPVEIMKKVAEWGQGVDRVGTESDISESNLNLNSNLNLKNVYGEFGKVKLTLEEYKKLIERMGEKNTNILIMDLDNYIASKGKKYSSHYATILNWARRKIVDGSKGKYKVSSV